MPSDSNFPNLPPSTLRDDDKFVVNRDNVSHKINASDFLYYFADVEFPVVKPCDADQDCPPGYICYEGKCVLRCDGGCDPNDPSDNHSCCPDGQICVQVDSNTQVCLPYPFPCDSLPIPSPCPDGFVCVGGLCFQQCAADSDCPPGHICAEIDGLDVCVPYPFPCPEDGICPPEFECYNGFCLLNCSATTKCPEGSVCIEVEIEDVNQGGTVTKYYCVPYPFPCGSIPPHPECPPGFYCFGGECYQVCQNDTDCPEGYSCTEVGNEDNNQDVNGQPPNPPISICMPTPTEGLINDGKLCIVDDQNDIRIVFTANQYGDTFLKFNGIDISGPDGGGSGTELTFNTLWSRVDSNDLTSDIKPTYENVDVLPHGTNSNVGSTSARWDGLFTKDLNITRDVYGTLRPNVDLAWDIGENDRRWGKVYTNNLRSIGIASDQIQSGTTSQRPTTKPEGGAITAGEIRFNTGRGDERIDQSRHSKDFEVYNGSQWVRMDTKAEGPLYDDNAETRLIYGRGLTTGNSGANPAGNGADSSIKSWAGYKTYNVPQLEAKIGRGLKFNTNGEIEQFANPGDDITILHNPVYIKRNQGDASTLRGNPGSVNGATETFPGGVIKVPPGCTRGIITFEHKVQLKAHDNPLDIDTAGLPFELADSLEEYRNNRAQLRASNPINFAWIDVNPQFTMSGASIIKPDGSLGLNIVGFSQTLTVVEEVGKKQNGGFWTSKSEMITCTPGDMTCSFTMPWTGYNVQEGNYGIYRVFLTPYET